MAGGREAHRARWVGVVEAWRRSGLTQVAFAEARGLRLDTLRAWCRRLGESPRRRRSSSPGSWPRGTPAGPAFVEVVSAGRTDHAGGASRLAHAALRDPRGHRCLPRRAVLKMRGWVSLYSAPSGSGVRGPSGSAVASPWCAGPLGSTFLRQATEGFVFASKYTRMSSAETRSPRNH